MINAWFTCCWRLVFFFAANTLITVWRWTSSRTCTAWCWKTPSTWRHFRARLIESGDCKLCCRKLCIYIRVQRRLQGLQRWRHHRLLKADVQRRKACYMHVTRCLISVYVSLWRHRVYPAVYYTARAHARRTVKIMSVIYLCLVTVLLRS